MLPSSQLSVRPFADCQFAFRHVEIGAANSTGVNLDQDFIGGGLRNGDVSEDNGT